MKCLLIETKNNRQFFTHEKNLPYLLEFSRTFNASVSLVKLEPGTPILELSDLALAFCDMHYQIPKASYKTLQFQIRTRTRKNILSTAQQVKDYILKKLDKNKKISLKEVRAEFDYLSNAALCNHIRRVKHELGKNGISFKKTRAGEYQCMT